MASAADARARSAAAAASSASRLEAGSFPQPARAMTPAASSSTIRLFMVWTSPGGRPQCWAVPVKGASKQKKGPPVSRRSSVCFQVHERGSRAGSDVVLDRVLGGILRLVGNVGGVLGGVGRVLGGVGGGVGHLVGGGVGRIGGGVGGAVGLRGGSVGGSLGGLVELAVGGVGLGLGLGGSVGSVSRRVLCGVLVRARGQGETHGQCQQSLVDGHFRFPRRCNQRDKRAEFRAPGNIMTITLSLSSVRLIVR